MSNQPSLKKKILQLKEIVPQHSEATIERVLRDKHGNFDSALTVLLELPANGVSQNNSQSPNPPKKAHSSPRNPSHIFPSDFLRWPPTAKVVREQIGSEAPTRQQEPQFVYQPPMPQTNVQPNPQRYDNPNQSKNPSAWSNFKDRFKSKDGKTYTQI